jgi:flagellar protein FliS
MINSHQIYSDIEVNSDVTTASSHRLIQLLFNKCIEQIQFAKSSIVNKDVNKKYYSISKAVDIINYLRFCLNKEDTSADEMVNLLTGIYVFLESHLMQGSLKNDTEYLDQVINILTSIKSGWDEIATSQ